MYKRTDLTLVPTQGLYEFLSQKNIDEHHMKVWGRGVNSVLFHPNKKNSQFKQNQNISGKKAILFVSRLVKEKETDTLINFYVQMTKSYRDWVLVVVGDGPEKSRLMKQMPGAVFLGKQVGGDLADIYASCDVFVFPSVTETFGNVILEAFASGIPVVAADAGGPSDIIQNGVNGLLAKPKDAKDLLSGVKRILTSGKLKNSLVDNARKYAENQNWDSLCGELNDLYYQLGSKDLDE